MQMQNLDNYKTGGLLHVIANNQIGFTTTPNDGRSTPYCTEIGKAYDAPIIHVNADNPIAVEFAFKLAAEFAVKYPKDIIVDVIGYRRYGHNELDDPRFTQPEMYKTIDSHKDIVVLFEEKLISEGIDKKELENINNEIKEELNKDYDKAKNEDKIEKEKPHSNWESFTPDKYSKENPTGVNIEKLKNLGEKICTIPNDFEAHKIIKKIYDNRLKSISSGKGIDWATAEALSWAVLLYEGNTVRLSGQDVERGTFSHRHSVLHDQNNFSKYIPLTSVTTNSNNLQICLSPLSEFAVLGFELGFSYYNPEALVMWEAQFGDFANGAQVIIDQFIASGESKWDCQTGIVLLLPHGMDGQGPEHSSARIERFLQLMEDSPLDVSPSKQDMQIQKTNMQLCNPTTPANYFHVLLRQQKRNFRKPLVIPSPKKLLRLKEAKSNIEDFSEGTIFKKIRYEEDNEVINNAKNVKYVLLCSGQVYYDLVKYRSANKIKDIAIIALEQVAPLPYEALDNSIKMFSNAKLRWVQEEHLNSGCWSYVEPRIKNLLAHSNKSANLTYVGRGPAASPATGFNKVHNAELEKLLFEAFKI